MATFNSLANDVAAARMPTINPPYRPASTPLADDYRVARVCAAAQLVQAGFDPWEARAIAAHACAGAAIEGPADVFTAIVAKSWASVRGERKLPSHPGGQISPAWAAAAATYEAAPRWTGAAYDSAARSA